MEKNHIYNLITKFFENNLPEDIQRHFQKWFVSRENFFEKENAMEDIWDKSFVYANDSTVKDLHNIHRRIDSYTSARGKRLYKRIMQVAAFFILPLLGVSLTYLIMWNNPRVVDVKLVECFVTDGNRKHVILPDGSDVWVNAGSILIYPEQFEGESRTLFLSGEAYFKVVKNPNQPFIVKTQNIEVEALGTVFNVQSYSNLMKTVATLEQGKVRVKAKSKNDDGVILFPDDQAIYDHITGEMTTNRQVDVRKVTCWVDGFLLFQGESFDYIMKALERQYGVSINYEGSKYAGKTFTVKFNPNEDVIQVLDVLKEVISGLHYKIKDKVIYIY